MKSLLLSLICFSLITPVMAQENPASDHGDGPCAKLREACQTAGRGKKSIYKDCIQPLQNGQKVEGVNVSPADIAACKAKKAELKAKK